MTAFFTKLLQAETDLGLFLVLCRLTQTAKGEYPLRTQLESLKQNKQHVLCLSIRQALRYPAEHQMILRWETVHRFILDETGQLTWERPEQPTLVGVQAIQAGFRQLWEQDGLPLIESLSA